MRASCECSSLSTFAPVALQHVDSVSLHSQSDISSKQPCLRNSVPPSLEVNPCQVFETTAVVEYDAPFFLFPARFFWHDPTPGSSGIEETGSRHFRATRRGAAQRPEQVPQEGNQIAHRHRVA